MATAPTTAQIHELATRRTAELGFSETPPANAGDPVLYREQRSDLLDRQIENARSELTRRHEHARQAEADARQRDQAEADAREADLRRRFDQRFPGGSDADFRALRPALLAEVSAEAAQVDQDALERAKRRIRI